MDDIALPFQPGTVSRDVLRRPVFLMGGMSALLLQVAEPRIAVGVVEHSDFANRIFDRLRHTVELMMEVGLGQPPEAERAVREMNRAHRGVRGSMPDGSSYDASDPDLRLWVHATLITTVLDVEKRYVGEFDEIDRHHYYRESLAIAELFGIDDPPSDLAAFRDYVGNRLASVEVTPSARDIADHVLHPRFGWLPPHAFAPLRLVTADLLPARLRHAYGLRLGPAGRRWLRRFQSVSRATLPRLPDWMRTFPLLRPAEGVRERILGKADTRLWYRPGHSADSPHRLVEP